MKKFLLCLFVFMMLENFAAASEKGEKIMRLITLEEHFTAQEIIEENNKFTEVPDFYKSMVFIGNSLTDIDGERIDFMDKHKIDMQVLSYTSPVSDQVPASEAVRICKRANDILAEKVKAHPERFAAFATLPMADPVEAAKELERCVVEYKFYGALLAGQFQGHFYEEKNFFPIFEKAAELDVPVSFHPAPINQSIQIYYYTSPEYSQFIAGQFASAGFGWHLDVGIHEVRLILSGLFDKLPNLKIIAGHWGELIPAYLERLDYMMSPQVTGLKKKISDYYKENFYITPSGILSPMQFEYMVKLMGADHIMWAVDYPYIKQGNFYEFLMSAEFLTDEEKELIAHKNAERILHIKGEN